uniref:Uncharacterized protein n=1 Tax=Arion vulgaris TaxID=1028688 RepID=A0A0B7APU2_9EUPU
MDSNNPNYCPDADNSESSNLLTSEVDISEAEMENITKLSLNTVALNSPVGHDQSYDNLDCGPEDTLPPFRPARLPGLHLPDVITRNDHRQYLTPRK